MELIDNVNKTLKDDLTVSIQKDSKISIAAACFSIYAFQELKRELKNVDELRFIFTSPTFIKEKAKKEKREFYIPRQTRERSLYGSEFEVKLRNEMTQRAIAKECAEWIRKKATFKSNVTSENMMGFMNVDSNSYMPLNGFTTIDLGCERGNNAYYPIQKTDTPMSQFYLDLFEQIWNDEARLQEVTDEVVDSITTVYSENSPDYIYFVTLYNIFNEFLEDVSEDVLPNEATGFKDSKIWNLLYNFQKDAVLAIINKLEKYNGCILADSVGLGKTFTSLAVIKYYENRNKSVLVLCPKKLANNWNTYKDNYVNNPIAADRMRYDVLFHTDLSREDGTSNGLDLDRLNWGNYDLVVIDESHNFRNGGRVSQDGDKENRYLKLLNKVIRKGVKTKVLMLSATPVNNRFVDLKNQLALAYEGESSILDGKLNTSRSIEDIFKQAQAAFNAWSKYEPQDRTTARLLKMLDFDFFEVLDSVTIARSRKHIEKYYDTSDIGTFPKRNIPISKRPGLTDLDKDIRRDDIGEFAVGDTLYNHNRKFNEETRPNLVFSIFYNPVTEEIVPGEIGEVKVGFVELLPHANGDGTHKYHAWRWSRQKIVNESYNLIVLPNSSGGYEVYTRIRDFNTTLLKDLITNVSNGDTEVQKLFGGKKYFDYPKSVDLLKILIGAVKDKDALILDFFSGSATTAHATMQLNREDGGNRQYIMVQIPDGIDEKSEAYKDGYHNLCEIGKERIRLAGAEIKEADIGFRVLKLDSSNMKDIYYNPAQIQQQSLFDSTDNIKEDRTPEDLLFQVMLDLGILLSSKIEEKTIAGKKVFNVADGFLIACFDNDVTEKTVKAVAQEKPYYAVFRDSSMANDSVATNFEQIFATYSPETVRKVL